METPQPKVEMNEVLRNIYSRRAVRDYLPDTVSDNVLREIIKAGSYAPSAMNEQPWRFLVIKNKDLMKRLSDKARELWIEQSRSSTNCDIQRLSDRISRPGFNIFYNAPVLIMIFANPHAFSPQIECALAAENMMLAAKSLGVGSCWIGLAITLGKAGKTLDELGVPSGYKLMASLIFGYPANLEQMAPAREENVIIKWIE